MLVVLHVYIYGTIQLTNDNLWLWHWPRADCNWLITVKRPKNPESIICTYLINIPCPFIGQNSEGASTELHIWQRGLFWFPTSKELIKIYDVQDLGHSCYLAELLDNSFIKNVECETIKEHSLFCWHEISHSVVSDKRTKCCLCRVSVHCVFFSFDCVFVYALWRASGHELNYWVPCSSRSCVRVVIQH